MPTLSYSVKLVTFKTRTFLYKQASCVHEWLILGRGAAPPALLGPPLFFSAGLWLWAALAALAALGGDNGEALVDVNGEADEGGDAGGAWRSRIVQSRGKRDKDFGKNALILRLVS